MYNKVRYTQQPAIKYWICEDAIWFSTYNPVLRENEIGLEKDSISFQFKLGDGSTRWNDLSYVSIGGGSVNSVTDDGNGVVTIDNTNPANPIVEFNGVNVDGVTITGDGTLGNPLVSVGGGGILKGSTSGTDTYTTTISGVTSYVDGDAYLIRFTNGNTTVSTLNINSLGAIPLFKNNNGQLIGGDITDGAEMFCIYNSTANNFQVIGSAPNTLLAYVTNDDSVTITKGQPVYAFSGTGDRLTVKLAYNTSDSTSAQTVGLVLSTSIASNQKGLIIIYGLLDGLNTLPTSTYADGDAIYLGATAGSITNVKPSAPNHLVYLGVCTTANNGSAGRMYVRVQNGYELQELHNVKITVPTLNNEGIFYNTSNSLWENKSAISVLSGTKSEFDTACSDGNFVFQSDALGTPSSGSLTNCNGLVESGLTLSDNTTNDVSITKHGFAPKSPNDGTKFLDGLGAYDTVKDSDLSLSDITTNNVTISAHGFVPKAPNNTTNFLRGDGTWAVPNNNEGWSIIVKSANQDVTNNATLQDDTDFQFSVVAGGHYMVSMNLTTSANNSTGDLKWGFNVSVGTMKGYGSIQSIGTTSAVSNVIVTANASNVTTAIPIGAESDLDFLVHSVISYSFTASANATFKFQFANNAAGAGRTSRNWKGSILKYKRLD